MKILQLREALERLGFKGDLRVMLKEHLVFQYLKAIYEVKVAAYGVQRRTTRRTTNESERQIDEEEETYDDKYLDWIRVPRSSPLTRAEVPDLKKRKRDFFGNDGHD